MRGSPELFRSCGKYQLVLVFCSYVHHVDYILYRNTPVGMHRNVYLGTVLNPRLQRSLQEFKIDGLIFDEILRSFVIDTVVIGRAEDWVVPLGNSSFRAVG